MELTVHQDIDEFVDRVRADLEREEAANSLPLGLAHRIQRGEPSLDPLPYLATISEGPDLRAVVLMSPPHPVVLATIERRMGGAVPRVRADASGEEGEGCEEGGEA